MCSYTPLLPKLNNFDQNRYLSILDVFKRFCKRNICYMIYLSVSVESSNSIGDSIIRL